MQLKKIKLAGFKSFVDPTELQFNSQLVGIVGPNGCGKSNIIDAIRWVMGESSAKTLRGAMMADVIFNGSGTRKPVNQASIDLYFDNSLGKLGGQYASYSEIIIRREVSRDGQSNYYFNGTRCRKRDIVDVFLGTGLGPRSYSIIEQGMISRVIEAKPEDLRAFLEEAAGISVYKKRKHETALRMEHTRENLARITDVKQELEKHIEKLEKQAEGARKYQQLTAEKEILEVELLALRWRSFYNDLIHKGEKVAKLSTELEGLLAQRASLDAQLERIRIASADKTDNFNRLQTNYYELSAQIARLEQTLEHHKERIQQLQQDLAEVMQNIAVSQAQLSADDAEATQLQQQLTAVNSEFSAARQLLTKLEEKHADSQLTMQAWREQWEQFQEQAHKSQERAEIEKARIEQLEQQTHDAQIRLDRIAKEQAGLYIEQLVATLQELKEKLTAKETELNNCKINIEDLQNQINAQRQQLKQQQQQANSVAGDLQAAKGRQASLQALQQAALGNDDQGRQAWLNQQGLLGLPRVAELLQVAPGWEQAVETVLGQYLTAVCLKNTADFANLQQALAANLPAINVDFSLQQAEQQINDLVNDKTNNINFANQQAWNSQTLLSKISTELPLASLLLGIYIAADLPEALALRAEFLANPANLPANWSIITANGVWIGATWLRVHTGADERRGVLQREQDLAAIEQTIANLTSEQVALNVSIVTTEQTIVALEQQQTADRKQLASGQQTLRELSNEISAVQTRYEYMHKRSAQLQQEEVELRQKLATAQQAIVAARGVLTQAIDEMAAANEQKAILTAEKAHNEQRLQAAGQAAREQQSISHELEIKQQTLATKARAITDSLARLNKHLADLCAKRDNLEQLLSANDSADGKAPIDKLKEELTDLLNQQISAEQELTQARSLVEEIEQQIKALEKDRVNADNAAQTVRNNLDEFRMSWQSLEVRKQTIEEELTSFNTTAEHAVSKLAEHAELDSWQERLEQISKQIERLGPVNMAAISEFATERERLQYLTAQHQDLSEALATLENAIKSIDKETRAKFKETFDQVNENFQKLFPKLFGGGKAELSLIGEDLLEAGVGVMAQPPGKRNSSIHLLSGGEKALTAVSLVFSIFQLNPAPFCMLDEVDAPLDDANVGRFCDLLVEMSEAVQFIFITHNKLTMEIAKQLSGVTMKEPGVSRLVSVDIDQAMSMVE